MYLFPKLAFQGVLKEKQQIMCSMELMGSWVNFKNINQPHLPALDDSLRGKKAFSLMYSDRSCITKHTASVPLLPLGKINPQFENQKQTTLKAPSHRFVCKQGTVVFEATVNYWNVYIPLCQPIIFWSDLSFRQKAEEILQCEVCCTRTPSLPSLVIATACVAGTGVSVGTDMGCSQLLLALLCLPAFNVVLEPHS